MRETSSHRKEPHGGNRPSLCNWLQALDAEARRLPRAGSWLKYSVFMFARYKRLRPRPPVNADRVSKSFCESGYETFCRQVLLWQTKIAQHPEGQRMLKGLGAAQREQLAALLLDINCAFEEYRDGRAKFPERRSLARSVASKGRMAQRKLETARSALADLRDYVKSLDCSYGASKIPDIADRCLKALPIKAELREPGPLGWMLDDGTTQPWNSDREDPTTFGMVQLYWFFRHGCHLSVGESEVRTAVIRHAFLAPLGTAEVDYQEEYNGSESTGSDAVRKAVRRFHPNQRTSR